MKKLLPLLAAAMLLTSACAQAGAASGPTKVTVTMNEWGVTLSQASVPAGKVTFVLKNTGKLTHELVILKTELASDKIPMRPAEPKKVTEPGSVGEIEDVDAGQTKQDTFDLAPGNYVLMCNEEEHYQAGMHIAFKVK
jgi:uncharacterized cupredoxin-like copper-binding protein